MDNFENEIKMYLQELLEIDAKSVKVNTVEPTGNGNINVHMKEAIYDCLICEIIK